MIFISLRNPNAHTQLARVKRTRHNEPNMILSGRRFPGTAPLHGIPAVGWKPRGNERSKATGRLGHAKGREENGSGTGVTDAVVVGCCCEFLWYAKELQSLVDLLCCVCHGVPGSRFTAYHRITQPIGTLCNGPNPSSCYCLLYTFCGFGRGFTLQSQIVKNSISYSGIHFPL